MDPKLTPESVGHFFEEEFEAWIRTEKADDDPETRNWRRQFFAWWIKWEECDSGRITRIRTYGLIYRQQEIGFWDAKYILRCGALFVSGRSQIKPLLSDVNELLNANL